MKLSFRDYHLFALLEDYEKHDLPLDVFISRYFRNHRALGSKDRGFIAETLYTIIRWKGLYDYLAGKDDSWDKRYELQQSTVISDYLNDENIPLHNRLSFPEFLLNLFIKDYGIETATEICLASNHQAPTTIRANLLKITREELASRLRKSGHDVILCEKSPAGLKFKEKLALFSLPEFKDGLFEMQDEASQLVADLVNAQPGQLVMDYCAGSGGKTLAFAHKMNNSGQLFLHDIRPWALQEAKKRLRRAGIQNAQVVSHEDEAKLKKLKKRMDWVLVDAPCSGTGTLRRNPDMKWKMTPEMIDRLKGQQRMIFEKALSFLKPNGRIIYATCSLLAEENQNQVEHFCKTYDLEIENIPFTSIPKDGEMDGFYAAVLTKKTTTESVS